MAKWKEVTQGEMVCVAAKAEEANLCLLWSNASEEDLRKHLEICWLLMLQNSLLGSAGFPKAQQDPRCSPQARQSIMQRLEDYLIVGHPPSFQGLCAPGSPEKTRTKRVCAVNIYNQPENKHKKHHHGIEYRWQGERSI